MWLLVLRRGTSADPLVRSRPGAAAAGAAAPAASTAGPAPVAQNWASPTAILVYAREQRPTSQCAGGRRFPARTNKPFETASAGRAGRQGGAQDHHPGGAGGERGE